MDTPEVPLIQKFDETPLHAIEFTSNWEPERFVFDFKSITPQFGPGGQPQVMVVHRVVSMDPWLAKQLAGQMNAALADYEKRFGEIKQSEAQQKAMKEMSATKSATATKEKPSYYG